jgi:hypothetical protein
VANVADPLGLEPGPFERPEVATYAAAATMRMRMIRRTAATT